ncbi:hypothetical protein RI844_14580 [Thalassotalea fonticola]|uniref:ESPR domain-containing protein n=1 Tax=Thalassotalea fonticola TaxID=3065649 RepID=A0ABZ0GL19_9GAMM|nr:hypothetical protein RI844_14580 [Colwelliaceae bacterium S1-1]
MKNNTDNTNSQKQEVANERRKFITKYGKLAIVTPVAVTALMSPKTSYAMSSQGNDGSDDGVI